MDEDPRAQRRAIHRYAMTLGFDALGVARADEPLDDDFARYEAFVDAGLHGTMAWLAEHRMVRRTLDGEGILPGAKSVLCLARRYARGDDETSTQAQTSIARYARGQDYHTFLRKKLRQLAEFVCSLGDGIQARALLDTAPVLERAWAARSGLGFIGKNGLLIVPGQGSYVLLGEVVTTLVLEPDVPLRERCGECTRCLDACPTQAFVRPFVLDARRCVAYLTIEHRGAMDLSLRPLVGDKLFGCDICQDVCPFNRTQPAPAEHTTPFAALPAWRERDVADLLTFSDAQWTAALIGSPLKRAKHLGLLRNAITVVANQRRVACVPVLEQLLQKHTDQAVRDHAAWALHLLRPVHEA